MRKSGRKILLPVLIIAAAGALVLLNSGSSFALRGAAPLEAASRPQIVTPTPAEQDGSTAGSTDGIVWMGVAMAVIIMLPVVLRIITLNKS